MNIISWIKGRLKKKPKYEILYSSVGEYWVLSPEGDLVFRSVHHQSCVNYVRRNGGYYVGF